MNAPIGFVGAGVMGSLLVRRLLAHGYHVLVFARTPAKAAELIAAGAESTADLNDLRDTCEIVLGCLLDDAAIESVYLGEKTQAHSGLLSECRPGQLFVEHGTFSPSLARRIARVADDRGARFIDAPLTGGPEGAADGTLVVMAGAGLSGADASVIPPRLLEILAVYSRAVHGTGLVGTGAELKLVNQLLVSVHMAVVAEAAALITVTGIDPVIAAAVLGSGWAASTMLSRELPLALAGDFTNRGASIGGLIHVQSMIAGAFADAGLTPQLLPAVRSLFSDATTAGLGDSDPAALVRLYAAEIPS